MKRNIFILFLTVLQSYSLIVFSQDLQFYREDIIFIIEKDKVQTLAKYHFCNLGEKDIRTVLFYPFPENTRDLIDSLTITEVKTTAPIPYREGKSGIFFNISVLAHDQAAYEVFFRQKLQGKIFKYILTSTETWHRPLEFANFSLMVPLSMTIDSLTYPPDTSYIQNDHRYYSWKKKDFMPDKDFEIYF